MLTSAKVPLARDSGGIEPDNLYVHNAVDLCTPLHLPASHTT